MVIGSLFKKQSKDMRRIKINSISLSTANETSEVKYLKFLKECKPNIFFHGWFNHEEKKVKLHSNGDIREIILSPTVAALCEIWTGNNCEMLMIPYQYIYFAEEPKK